MICYWIRNNLQKEQQEIQLGEPFAKGGEGAIRPVIGQDKFCAKVYTASKSRSETRAKLEKMLDKREISFQTGGICWPQGILLNEHREFIGYVMERVPNAMKTLLHLMRAPLREQFVPQWDRESLCCLSLRILDLIESLHENKILIGDINENNILFATDPTQVFFVDTDSFQIGNYLCPVGQIHFTPPELLDHNFSETPRTIEHELFAISVLIFKIFMLGQTPYAAQGGTSPANNIRQGNFPYPLSIDENKGVPKGRWEAIWRSLSYGLKELFVSTFREHKRHPITEWRSAIECYREEILGGRVMGSMQPENLELILKGRATKIDDGRKKGFGSSINILQNVSPPDLLGVLELSTRAAKLLLGEPSKLLQGFTWNAFKNEAVLTYTGQYIDEKNILPLAAFRQFIYPKIKKLYHIARQSGVKRLYVVATAAYRSAANREEIITFLQQELNLNVQILDRREEARATVDAYLWSCPQALEPGTHMFIDQGGGSTEVTFFDESGKILGSAPVPIGTTSAINTMLLNAYLGTALTTVLDEGAKAPKPTILRNTLDTKKRFKTIASCIGVGTAITKATGKEGNKKQHGTVLTIEKLKEKQAFFKNSIIQQVPSVAQLASYIDNVLKNEELVNKMVTYLGISMYLVLLERFDQQQIVVNGTSLRYGIFHQELKALFPDYQNKIDEYEQLIPPFRSPVDNSQISNHVYKSKTFMGITEGEVVSGVIKNTKDFGIFINLGPVDGLLHISEIENAGKQLGEFHKGNTLDVLIKRIQLPTNANPKAKISLGIVRQ